MQEHSRFRSLGFVLPSANPLGIALNFSGWIQKLLLLLGCRKMHWLGHFPASQGVFPRVPQRMPTPFCRDLGGHGSMSSPFWAGEPVFGNCIHDLSQDSVALSQMPLSYFQPLSLNSGVFPKVLPHRGWKAVVVAGLYRF